MKTAMAIVVSDEQRVVLESMVRSQTIDVRAARLGVVKLVDVGGGFDVHTTSQLGRTVGEPTELRFVL